jgi:hypothetical protein
MPLDFEEGLKLLVESAPVLRDECDRMSREWAPEPPPTTVLMGALGHGLVNAIDRLATKELMAVSAAVEHLLVAGTTELQDATATGFLEALVHASCEPRLLARMVTQLGPAARDYLRAWDRFTGVRTPGLYDSSE